MYLGLFLSGSPDVFAAEAVVSLLEYRKLYSSINTMSTNHNAHKPSVLFPINTSQTGSMPKKGQKINKNSIRYGNKNANGVRTQRGKD